MRELQKTSDKSDAKIKNGMVKEILSECRQLEYDNQDLASTVEIVESNPEKFKISREEIGSRKAFVQQVNQQI